jgi:hypothetical protein
MRPIARILFTTGLGPVAQGLREIWAGRRYTTYQSIGKLRVATVLREIRCLTGDRPRVLIFLWDGVVQGSKREKVKAAVNALGRKKKLVILVEISQESGEASNEFRHTFASASTENVRFLKVTPDDTVTLYRTLDEWVEAFSPGRRIT